MHREAGAGRRAPSRASPCGSPPGTASRTCASSAPGCRGPSAGRRATTVRPSKRPSPATIAPSSARAAVAVQLDPVVEHPLDVVERVRPLLVAGELDRAPDLLVGRLGLRSARAGAGAARARRRASRRRAAERCCSLRQPLAQPALGLTRHCRRAAGAAADVGPQLGARDDRVEVAEAEVRLGEAEVVRELLARGLLDDARAGERDQRAGLGDGHVAEAREAREHAGRGRVGQDVDQRAARRRAGPRPRRPSSAAASATGSPPACARRRRR